MSSVSRPSAGPVAVAALLAVLVALAGLPRGIAGADVVPDHLVVSEVVTGGTSASDELIEVYNPTLAALPLEGLELVYVTASGATVTRRAAWDLGAPDLAPGRHVLVANELGVYAGIADAVYASGMASTGGSVALRVQGASSAIDALGWGSAASTWLEGTPAAAPSAGSSLERLPGGALGSTVDTGNNLADFGLRTAPEPQNLASAPVPDPGATPSAVPTGSPGPTVVPTATAAPTVPPTATPSAGPTSTPGPADDVVPIATARALPDGTRATIEGTAVTDSAFTDGGGFVTDEGGGIAILVSGGTFARGERLRLTGAVDDRFSQRTLRVEASGLTRLGTGSEPAPAVVTTGAIGEDAEGRLVRVTGVLVGSASELSGGVAFDLDDGSGPTRLVVATATGIDVSGWESGTRLALVGVVGQRDSTGSGISGYRLHPRDAADILSVDAPPSPTPHPSSSASPDPSPGDEPPAGVISIAAARELPKNAPARVRGTVTLAPGTVDPTTAVIQDGSGAIVLRIGEEVGTLARGEVVTVDGVRSTKSGMETLRVTVAPTRSGRAPEPVQLGLKTGSAGEADEARLVRVRGAVAASARRSASGSVSFEIDDGSGPLRISIGAGVGADHATLISGTWVEVTGILGQETTGAQPLRGYRVWPRAASDLRVLAGPTEGVAGGAGSSGVGGTTADPPTVGLDAIGGPAGASERIGATLVSAAWPEIDAGGLLWDGTRLVALQANAADVIRRLLGRGRPPVSVELIGLRAAGSLDDPEIPVVRIGDDPDALLAGSAPAAAPATALPDDGDAPRWVALVGRVAHREGAATLVLHGGRAVALDVRCARAPDVAAAVVGVTGIATPDPARILVPCDGIRPAPGLGRATLVTTLGAAGPRSAHLAGLAGDGSARDTAPSGPGALLGLAAMGLVGGALVARRVEHDGHDGSDPQSAEPDDEAGDASDAPTPPILTLVPVPRDRAP